jgi:hypothetical protein
VTSHVTNFRKPLGLTMFLYFRLAPQAITCSNCQPISNRLRVKSSVSLQKVQQATYQQLTPSPTLPVSFVHEIPSHVPRTHTSHEEHSRMSIDTQRILKRTPATMALQISSANQPSSQERTRRFRGPRIQNISGRMPDTQRKDPCLAPNSTPSVQPGQKFQRRLGLDKPEKHAKHSLRGVTAVKTSQPAQSLSLQVCAF